MKEALQLIDIRIVEGRPARGRVPDIKVMHRAQTPRRRIVLFRGVCRFYHISAIFRVFCLVVKRNFVYLHTVKGVATICSPCYINVNKLKILRNALNLSFLRFALRNASMRETGTAYIR